ncbi:MAG: hypothetical protein CMM38_03765 [Rhodospirillaceae bacterium]|nr:hypothetical protein [Rhodospirillaceae bacterium]
MKQKSIARTAVVNIYLFPIINADNNIQLRVKKLTKPAKLITLKTKRLEVLPADRELVRALINNRQLASKLTGGLIHRDFPDSELAAKLPAFAQRLDDASNPALGRTAPAAIGGWGLWLFFYKPERLVVGAASFNAPPTNGQVELGYQVVPAHRRRGLTFEGCSALIEWAFSDSQTTSIVAECNSNNIASVHTLEKLGFTLLENRVEQLKWQLLRTDWISLHKNNLI